MSAWTENADPKRNARWGSEKRRAINVCIDLSDFSGRAVHASITRKTAPAADEELRTLDDREFDICKRIAAQASDVLGRQDIRTSPTTLRALAARFDEDVVADHLRSDFGLQLDVRELLEDIRSLAGQTYENRAISLGCLIDSTDKTVDAQGLRFPSDFLTRKKFKALTDGFRTAYLLSSSGHLSRLLDLQRFDSTIMSTGREMFPEWAADLARLSRFGRCGIALTRVGDILVFGDGNLRFVYRFGRWRYLNHTHIINLLKSLARVQHVPRAKRGAVIARVYRIALDVSFRRSGGLIVLLRAVDKLAELVQPGDAMADTRRGAQDNTLDGALPTSFIETMSRRVLVELASLDGALVIANSGELLAYSAILKPRSQGRIRRTEGSRTKAAIGASNYGLAIKISSDGDIQVFRRGNQEPVLAV